MNTDKRRSKRIFFPHRRSSAFIGGHKSFALAFLAIALTLSADVSPDLYLAHVRYLASPELKGRATGSPGLEKAAHYIAAQFRSFGLTPTELPFPVQLGAHLGTKNRLKFKEPHESRSLTEGKDY